MDDHAITIDFHPFTNPVDDIAERMNPSKRIELREIYANFS